MAPITFQGRIHGGNLVYVTDGIHREAVKAVFERVKQQNPNFYHANLLDRSFQAIFESQDSDTFFLCIDKQFRISISRTQAKNIIGQHEIDRIAPLLPSIYVSVINSVSHIFFTSIEYTKTALSKGSELRNVIYSQSSQVIVSIQRIASSCLAFTKGIIELRSSNPSTVPSQKPTTPIEEFPSQLLKEQDSNERVVSMTLHEAVAGGNIAQVRVILNPQNASSKDAQGKTPLHLAVFNPSMVRLLLAGGANLEAKDREGNSPLAEAAQKNQVLTVDLLLASGARVNTSNKQLETPLHIAAGKGCIQVVLSLLKYRPDLNARDHQSRTPFLTALVSNRPNIADELAQKGSNLTGKDSLGNTGLHYAAMHGMTHWMDRLIAAKLSLTDRNQEKKTPLHLLAASGAWGKTPEYAWTCEKEHDLSGVFFLVSEGASKAGLIGMEVRIDAFLNFMDPSTIPLGIEFILQHKGDPAFTAKSLKKLLWLFSAHSNAAGLRFLFQKYGALIAKTDITEALQKVVGYETITQSSAQLEVIKLLLDNKADVNACAESVYGESGITPLHSAAQRGNVGMVELLLSRGADVRKRTSKDRTPADVATTDEIRRLLEKKYRDKIRAHSLRWASEALRFWSDDYARHSAAVYWFNKESISDEEYASVKELVKQQLEYSEKLRSGQGGRTHSYGSSLGASLQAQDWVAGERVQDITRRSAAFVSDQNQQLMRQALHK